MGTNTTYFASETDNAQYDCFTFNDSSSNFATAIYNSDNWNTSNSSQFSALNCDFGLPVKLTSIKAESKENSNQLNPLVIIIAKTFIVS